MYVCLCSGITDKQIHQALESGCDSLRDLRRELGVGSRCGKCLVAASDLLRMRDLAADAQHGGFPSAVVSLWQPA